MNKRFAALFLGIILPVAALAQDVFDPLGDNDLSGQERQIRIFVEWIDVDHATMTEMMAKPERSKTTRLISANDAPLRENLAKLIEKDEATLVETMMVVARSGQRAKVESISEFIYPTEYDPPVSVKTSLDGDGNRKSETKSFSAVPIGTAFETRNVGATLEVDPVLGADERTIDLNLAPELVYQNGFEVYSEHKEGETKSELKMPRFFTVKVTTQATLLDGEPLLIGALTPRDVDTGETDPERKLLVFVRADVIVTGLPTERE